VRERIRRRSVLALDRILVGGEWAGHGTLKNPKIVGENLTEGFGGHAKIRGENIRWCMGDPVGYQQGVEFGLRAVVEGQNEFAPVRPESLQRVGISRREVPQ